MKRSLTVQLLHGALMVGTAWLTHSRAARACTRVLWNDNKFGTVSGRTMDWPQTTEPVLTVFPRGMKRNGGSFGTAVAIAENPKVWTSKYGSLVTTVYGIGTVDGMNERGLGIHALYLRATDFGPRDARQPGLHAGVWAQYLLDNAATVTEALSLLDGFQVVMVEMHGFKATIHLALEDATGDSAIIEYIDGKRVVHHGRQYKVMTNDPHYEEQLALLKNQDFSKPSSDTPLPGNVNPVDRFQRTTYFASLLPEPKDERQAIASMFAVARNASVPFGAPYRTFGIYNTEYRTVMNLAAKRYFFELSTSPNVLWADLTKMNLAPGAPVMILNPDDLALSGNVTEKFVKAAKVPF